MNDPTPNTGSAREPHLEIDDKIHAVQGVIDRLDELLEKIEGEGTAKDPAQEPKPAPSLSQVLQQGPVQLDKSVEACH